MLQWDREANSAWTGPVLFHDGNKALIGAPTDANRRNWRWR
jgi:hypothetical protein